MDNLPVSSVLKTLGLSPRYWEDLVHCGYQTEEEPLIGEFGRLQRLNLTHLLNEITRIEASVKHNKHTSHSQMESLRQLLHQYTNAVRDYEYLSQQRTISAVSALKQRALLQRSFPDITNLFSGNDKNESYDNRYLTFHVTSTQETDPIREFLNKVLSKEVSWTEKEKEERHYDYSQGLPPQIYSPLLDKLARFIVGVAGGCALILPMVGMIFSPSLTKSLIAVSIAVVLFALGLSLIFKTDNKDTVTATATYAAVLVVFVGTSLSNQVGPSK